jgi:hypothetical protein
MKYLRESTTLDTTEVGRAKQGGHSSRTICATAGLERACDCPSHDAPRGLRWSFVFGLGKGIGGDDGAGDGGYFEEGFAARTLAAAGDVHQATLQLCCRSARQPPRAGLACAGTPGAAQGSWYEDGAWLGRCVGDRNDSLEEEQERGTTMYEGQRMTSRPRTEDREMRCAPAVVDEGCCRIYEFGGFVVTKCGIADSCYVVSVVYFVGEMSEMRRLRRLCGL